MRFGFRGSFAAVLISLALASVLSSLEVCAQSSSTTTVGDLTISQPWSRATPGSAPVAGGYFSVSNGSGTPDRLIGVATDLAAKAEVHEMAMANGVMTMRQVAGGLPVPAKSSVDLKPGGFHVMFMGLKQGLKEGDTFKATLQFEKAGPVEVTFTVGSIAASKAPEPMAHDHMH